jgi:hypothetical protein
VWALKCLMKSTRRKPFLQSFTWPSTEMVTTCYTFGDANTLIYYDCVNPYWHSLYAWGFAHRVLLKASFLGWHQGIPLSINN